MNKINLDKICAEYGMNLLEEFKEINLSTNINFEELKNLVNVFKDRSVNTNFDVSRKEEYIQKLNEKISERINDIVQSDYTEIKKYILISWFFLPLMRAVTDKKNVFSDQYRKIDKEKNRINKLIKDQKKQLEFNFSPSNFETEITKALGILVEDGPFAYMIWLKSQDREPHIAMLIQTARILAELKVIDKIETSKNLKEEIEKGFLNLSEDLSKLLFVKTILEKMLIYARYKAKAMENEVSEG